MIFSVKVCGICINLCNVCVCVRCTIVCEAWTVWELSDEAGYMSIWLYEYVFICYEADWYMIICSYVYVFMFAAG